MKHQTTVVGMITKHVPANLALKIGKLFMLIALFCTSSIKAQCSLADYPATDLGQSLLITTTDPNWGDLEIASAAARASAQEVIDNAPDPCALTDTDFSADACSGVVCCRTITWWSYICQCYKYKTTCVNTATLTNLDTH